MDSEKHRDSLSLDMTGESDFEQISLLKRPEESLESQGEIPLEYRATTLRKAACLILYFALNLGVTLSNKAVLQTARYPWLLTAIHAATTWLGCFFLKRTNSFHCTKLSSEDNMKLVAFSCLFTANIATSNVSLSVSEDLHYMNDSLTDASGLVSVPFHQVLRSTVPVVTILIYRWVYGRSYNHQTYWTMVPLVAGVGLATFGDYFFTYSGFALTFLGVLLAAIKSIASNRLMTGTLNLSALEILYRMSPLAAVQSLVCAITIGEFSNVKADYAGGQLFTDGFVIMLTINALMAFMLNGISFYTNKIAGALTISVCANLKQVLTILLGIIMFKVSISPVHGLGMAIALAGAAWYSKAELDANRERDQISLRK